MCGRISGSCSVLCRFSQALPQTHLHFPQHPRVFQWALVTVFSMLCSSEKANSVFWKHFRGVYFWFFNNCVCIFVKYRGRAGSWKIAVWIANLLFFPLGPQIKTSCASFNLSAQNWLCQDCNSPPAGMWHISPQPQLMPFFLYHNKGKYVLQEVAFFLPTPKL